MYNLIDVICIDRINLEWFARSLPLDAAMINGKRRIPDLNTHRSMRFLSGSHLAFVWTNCKCFLSQSTNGKSCARKRVVTFSFALVGVSGAIIKLDQSGDSEGNFSVLALKKEPFNLSNFTCDYQMKPVGQFQQGETLVSELFVAFQKIFHSGS